VSPETAPANEPDRAPDLEAVWQQVQPAAARRLLVAAAEAFAVRGFHATRTRDIAQGAGMSPAGVYVHYRSKEELLYRITLTGHQQTLALIRTATAGAAGPTARLTAVIAALTAWHARQHTTTRVIEYELHSLTPDHHTEIVHLRREVDGLVRQILADGVACGDFDVPDVPTTTLALLSLSVDVARWYHPSPRLTPEHLGGLYADLALRMVGGAGSAAVAD
jgi:AcrR family transcriptional regulator